MHVRDAASRNDRGREDDGELLDVGAIHAVRLNRHRKNLGARVDLVDDQRVVEARRIVPRRERVEGHLRRGEGADEAVDNVGPSKLIVLVESDDVEHRLAAWRREEAVVPRRGEDAALGVRTARARARPNRSLAARIQAARAHSANRCSGQHGQQEAHPYILLFV